MPSAERCRRAFGQRPPRGRRKGTPGELAGDAGKGDAERSILDACCDQNSRKLVNLTLPRAGCETPTVDCAFCQPLAGAVRTTGFLERTTMDRDRICHGKSVFKARRHAEAILEVLFRCSGIRGSRRQRNSGKRDTTGFRCHFPKSEEVQTQCSVQRTVSRGPVTKPASLGRPTSN